MNIFVAAFMRTGSSHLVYSMGRMLNYRVTTPQMGFAGKAGTDEHIVNYSVLCVQTQEGNFVFHQHCKGTGNNVHILKAYHFKPIIMMRNLYDCIVSCWDQMPASPHMTVPGVKRPPWNDMTEEQRWLWMGFNVIPWYYSFYNSWMQADIPKHIVWYDEHYKDQKKSMKKIFKFIDLPKDQWPSSEKMDKEIEPANTSRLHIGKSGRGEAVPEIIKVLANDQADQWGPWAKQMKRDLL